MLDGVFKCDHPTCEWSGKCPSDKRYGWFSFSYFFFFIFIFICRSETDGSVIGNTRLAIASCSNATS
jgi:hypothetical protein